MNHLETLVFEAGIMPILFAEKSECAGRVVRALERTAIPVVEILQRGEAALNAFKEAVRLKTASYIGAGTVCTLESCKQMVDLGADFIVSPGYNPEIVNWCIKRDIPIIPGVSNPTEVMLAAEAGIKMAKYFPFYDLGGEKYLNSMSGPFPGLKFIITGCIDDRELPFLSNTKIAAVGGVWPFQSEINHTVVSEHDIVERINRSIEIGRHYRNRARWDEPQIYNKEC